MATKRKILLLLLPVLFLSINIMAQNAYSIKGRIYDEKAEPMQYLNVALFTFPDSVFITGTATRSDGSFLIRFVKKGKYELRLSYVGFNKKKFPVNVNDKNLDIGIIKVESAISELQEIKVSVAQIRVVQKGDTTEYNADSYKVKPDANLEELISKMPGITIDENKIQAQGEDVKKVTIDGEEFFGDDASIALKNLPAEIVSKIQVFDQQGLQSQFTGVMDANTIKTINVITKNPDAKFTFGRVYGGYGTNNRNNSGGNLNYFNGKQRITLLGTSNNINQQNFSSEDLLGITTGGNGGMGGGAPGGGGNSSFGQQGNDFLVETQGGVNTTNSIGINYIDRWGTKIKVNGSYFYNRIDNVLKENTVREYYFSERGDEGMIYSEEKTNESSNQNHRLNLEIDYKIDYANRIIFTPKLSFQSYNGFNTILAGNVGQAGQHINETTTENIINSKGLIFAGDLLYMHSFRKDGRTASVNINSNYNKSDSDDKLESFTFDFQDNSTKSTRDQKTETVYDSRTYSANINYTEPISDKVMLLLNYIPSYTISSNDKENYLYDIVDDGYTLFDSIYSNSFKSKVMSQKVGFTVQAATEKTTFNAGLAYQNNNLRNDYLFPETEPVSKIFHSLLPTLMFMHKFNKSTNIRLFLRSGNTLPSVSQLQEVVDNSNPLQLRKGNSQLDQDNYRMLLFRFGKTNQEKGRSFFAFLMLQHKNDYIGNSMWIARNDTISVEGIELMPNTQLTTYKNFDNYFNVRTFLTYGLPVYSLKSNLNINGGFGYSKIPGETNGTLNYAYNTNLNFGTVLSSNISENIDFLLSYSADLHWINNSFYQVNNSNYIIHTIRLNCAYTLKERLMFKIDNTFNYYQGIDNLPDNTPILINASLAYKFLKKRNLELSLSAYDILNQNIGIVRNSNTAFTEDVETNVLEQYFMLTLSYKFNSLI
ncbi:MAG: outer membrane beta-barrel protein [Bacteroidota bacterium]